MNEFDFLTHNLRSPKASSVVQGPGDDCSIIEYNQDDFLISSTDLLVEEIHFKTSEIKPEELAYKALAVNISDIAAMGGQPYWAHLSLAVPEYFSEKNMECFFESFYELAENYKISLVGGDLSRSSSKLFINIHLSGLVKKNQIQRRSDFKKSELVCVTGSLGESSAGLYSLVNKLNGESEDLLKKKHFTPPIELEKALWLAEQPSVHGMMDLSDGLLSDLKRISGIGFKMNLDKIPHSDLLLSFCKKHKFDPFQFSLAGGEDYRILFGCDENNFEELQQAFKKKFSDDFFVIGRTQSQLKIDWFLDGEQSNIAYSHFNHFSDANG